MINFNTVIFLQLYKNYIYITHEKMLIIFKTTKYQDFHILFLLNYLYNIPNFVK